jgi:hypothetical protein
LGYRFAALTLMNPSPLRSPPGWSVRLIVPLLALSTTLPLPLALTSLTLLDALPRPSVLDCYRTEHWDAAIRVVRYLKGTRLHTLELGGSHRIRLLGFSDSDYANCPDTSRSVGGYCFSLGSGMISWASRKQQHAADSTCYSEYIAMHEASHELLFFRQFLDGLDMPIFDTTPPLLR